MIEPPLSDDYTLIVNECTPVFGIGWRPTTFEKLYTEVFFIIPSMT